MQLTKAQARRAIEELNLPEVFVALFDGTTTLLELGLSQPVRAFRPFTVRSPGTLIPLFEHRGENYFCETAPEGRRFIAFNLDSPEEVTVFGRSFQCVLAALFMAFWEDERNDYLLPVLADRLEFLYLADLLDDLSIARKLAREPYLTWRRKFWAECEAAERQEVLALDFTTEESWDWSWRVA
jgi:hypothetical protein